MPTEPAQSAIVLNRGQELLKEQLAAIYRRGDRLFVFLMLLQWAAAIVAALWISPLTWSGPDAETHLHVWTAVFLGAAISSLPIWLAVYRPDAVVTRHVVAVAQMLWSALLIHLTGGRIETHFHVFGSLALLAWYRDVGVLVTATIVVAADHFLRGIFWSESVYGVVSSTPWRSVEHSAWVLFEDVFLWISIRYSLGEMRELANNHAALEHNHEEARAEMRKQSEELEGTEARLRQAQKMEAVGQLAGGVAHDFNNLLTIISGYSQLVLNKLRPTDAHFEEINEVRIAADRAASLTRQLLAFSRKQILAPKLLDVNTIVREMDKLLRRLIGEDIELSSVLDPALGRIHADPGQIEQVIMNLALNSRDAMSRGGRLTIETRNVDAPSLESFQLETQFGGGPLLETNRYVMLAITDNGSGMDEQIKAHIFEPFFTTKEVGKGTGLGLATVYGIVKQSGGLISVYSEPGQGTTFKIYLPRVRVDSDKPDVDLELLRPRPGTETILLVEDEVKVRTLARNILQSNGYTVIEASDGSNAIDVATAHPEVSLVLTDVVMPKMGGRQLAERLKASHPGLRVLYMSGYTDDAVIRHGILEADTSFLQKPFSPHALLNKVREVLDAPPTSVSIRRAVATV